MLAHPYPYTARSIELACSMRASFENLELRRGLRVLDTVAQVAPLLGFLAGVAGLMHCLSIYAFDASFPWSSLPEPILATACGLFTGLSATFAQHRLRTRADRFELEMRLAPAVLLRQLGEREGPWIAASMRPVPFVVPWVRERALLPAAITFAFLLAGFLADLSTSSLQVASLDIAFGFTFLYVVGRVVWMWILHWSHWNLLVVTAALNLVRIFTLLLW